MKLAFATALLPLLAVAAPAPAAAPAVEDRTLLLGAGLLGLVGKILGSGKHYSVGGGSGIGIGGIQVGDCIAGTPGRDGIIYKGDYHGQQYFQFPSGQHGFLDMCVGDAVDNCGGFDSKTGVCGRCQAQAPAKREAEVAESNNEERTLGLISAIIGFKVGIIKNLTSKLFNCQINFPSGGPGNYPSQGHFHPGGSINLPGCGSWSHIVIKGKPYVWAGFDSHGMQMWRCLLDLDNKVYPLVPCQGQICQSCSA